MYNYEVYNNRNNNVNRFNNRRNGYIRRANNNRIKKQIKTNLRRRNYNINRFNNKRNNNFNYNNGTYTRIFNSIDKLSQKFDQMRLKEPTNLMKNKTYGNRQERNNKNNNRSNNSKSNDNLLTPMEMALQKKFYSIEKTNSEVVYLPIYTTASFQLRNDYSSFFIWFPYAVNFVEFSKMIGIGAEGVYANNIIPFIHLDYNANKTTIHVNQLRGGKCGIVGNYRVIGATMKIYNVTSNLSRAGDYIIYKASDNKLWPPFVYSETQILSTTKAYAEEYTLYKDMVDYTELDFTQLSPKQNFSCNDFAYIHEWNFNEGNSIFGSDVEYLGVEYTANGGYPTALYPGNPTGKNVKYITKFYSTTNSAQTYRVEFWQMIEIIPDPQSGLSLLTEKQKLFSDRFKNILRKQYPYEAKN